MKTQVTIGIIVVAIGAATVVSFCSPKAAKKGLHQPAAIAKPTAGTAGNTNGDRPTLQGKVASAVVMPYDPKQVALFNKYEQLLEQGDRTLAADPKAAEGYYRQASSLIPYRQDAWLGLGRAMDAQGKSTEAFPAYKQAFDPPSGAGLYSSFPSDVASFVRYGMLCEEAGQHEAALKVYNQACDRLNPKPDVPLKADALPSQQLRARLEMVRGVALAEAKDHSGQDRDAEALQAFQAAAQKQPSDPFVQFYLGYGLRKAGRFAEAQAAFQKAAVLDTEGTVKAAAGDNLRAVQAHLK